MSDYATLVINMFLGSLNLVQTLSVIENRIWFDPTLNDVESGISTLLKRGIKCLSVTRKGPLRPMRALREREREKGKKVSFYYPKNCFHHILNQISQEFKSKAHV
jgi:hypothetical protein